MTTIEIRVSAKKTKVTETTGKRVLVKTIMNECFGYCADQYVRPGCLIELSVSPNGNADIMFMGWHLLQKKFNVTDAIFGNKLMLFIDKSNLKIA